jgi:hypothetical protein
VRSDDPALFPESQFLEKLSDTASAKDSPDLELFISPGGHKVGLCAYDGDKDANSEVTTLIRNMEKVSLMWILSPFILTF